MRENDRGARLAGESAAEGEGEGESAGEGEGGEKKPKGAKAEKIARIKALKARKQQREAGQVLRHTTPRHGINAWERNSFIAHAVSTVPP